MGFKEMVAADRLSVFLNDKEFAVEATVEGQRITIVTDDERLKNRQGGQELAIADSTTLFSARVEDLPPNLAPGASLNINGRERIVDDVGVDMGMATVVLREVVVT